MLAAGVGAGFLGVEHGAVTLVVLQEGIGGDALQVVLGDEVFYYIGELGLATGLFVLEHEAVELEVEETPKLCLDEMGGFAGEIVVIGGVFPRGAERG